MKLPPDYYTSSTLKISQNLLGKFLIHKTPTGVLTGQITETESYVGPRDKASHASCGRTPRTELMFGPPGVAYIYLIYGLYHCFNIVTAREGYPAAVLIRGIKTLPTKKNPSQHLDGPGKLTRFMKIDKTLNGIDLAGNTLWLEDRGIKISPREIERTKRLGIDYAEEYRDKLWRFIWKND